MAMFGTSWAGGQDRRIEVRVDSSWVVIALLITSSMYQQVSQARGIRVLDITLFLFGGASRIASVAGQGLRRWRTLEGSAH
jgi:hypothetical protein